MILGHFINLRQSLDTVLGHLFYEINYYSLHTGDMMFHTSFVIIFCLHCKSRLYRLLPKPLTTPETEIRYGFK